MRLLDIGMRHCHEIGILEHRGEGLDEIGIGARERGGIEAGVRVKLGIEIEVVLPQAIEQIEILITIEFSENRSFLEKTASFPT